MALVYISMCFMCMICFMVYTGETKINDTYLLAYFLDFRAQKFPLIFFLILILFNINKLRIFWVLNYEKQHKEGNYTGSGRLVIFSAFYADFLSMPQISNNHHLKPTSLSFIKLKVRPDVYIHSKVMMISRVQI